jgi:hypothetical protein
VPTVYRGNGDENEGITTVKVGLMNIFYQPKLAISKIMIVGCSSK